MKLKLLCVSFVLIVSLPLLVAVAPPSTHVPQSAMVAYAGHTISGTGPSQYCVCGCPDCICDPGETPTECPAVKSLKLDKPGKPAVPAPGGDRSDAAGPISMLLFTAFLLLRKLL